MAEQEKRKISFDEGELETLVSKFADETLTKRLSELESGILYGVRSLQG